MAQKFFFASRSDSSVRYELGPSKTYKQNLPPVNIYDDSGELVGVEYPVTIRNYRPWRDWPNDYILIGAEWDAYLDSGNVIQAASRSVPVPALAAQQGARFEGTNEDDGYWQIVPDYRGEVWYRKDTAAPFVVQQLGFDPTTDLNLTDAVPPSDIGMAPVWDADADDWTLVVDHRGEIWWDKLTAQRIVIATPGTVPSTLIDVEPHIEAGSGLSPDRWNSVTEEWNAYVYSFKPTTGEYLGEGVVAYGVGFELPPNTTQITPPEFDPNRERVFDALSDSWSYGDDLRGKRFRFPEFKYLYQAALAGVSMLAGPMAVMQSMLASLAERLSTKADTDHTHSIESLPVAAYDETSPNKLVLSSDPRLVLSGQHALPLPSDIGAPTVEEAQAMANGARDTAIAKILGGAAPETLDTILEIATALQNNPDVITTLQTIQGAHVADAMKHITAEERTTWNSKADGDHNHDGDYAPIEHVGDAVAHVTVGDRATWDAKADGEHVHSIGEVLSLQATLDDLQAQINTSSGVILDRISGSAGSGAGTKTINLPAGVWDVLLVSDHAAISLYNAARYIFFSATGSVSFPGATDNSFRYIAYKVGV